MTRSAELVRTSMGSRATPSRRARSERLGECLRSLRADQTELAVNYLIGVLPQGRIGLGSAAVRDSVAIHVAAVGSAIRTWAPVTPAGFVMLSMTFKGLTDATLKYQTQRLLALKQGRDGQLVRVPPESVVGVAFGAVQSSPKYPGGVALRFARARRYREDKTADRADTIGRVREFKFAGALPVSAVSRTEDVCEL